MFPNPSRRRFGFSRLGKIVFGTYCPDPGGKDFADIPVKTAEVRDSMILAVNGDSVVWSGAITGFNFYFENVRCMLSEVHTGFIRINYVTFSAMLPG